MQSFLGECKTFVGELKSIDLLYFLHFGRIHKDLYASNFPHKHIWAQILSDQKHKSQKKITVWSQVIFFCHTVRRRAHMHMFSIFIPHKSCQEWHCYSIKLYCIDRSHSGEFSQFKPLFLPASLQSFTALFKRSFCSSVRQNTHQTLSIWFSGSNMELIKHNVHKELPLFID